MNDAKQANTTIFFNEPDNYFRAEREQMERTKVPERYRNADLRKCRPEVQEFAKAFRAGTTNGHGLLLVGGCGTGKTYEACSTLNYLQHFASSRLLYANIQALLADIRSSYGNNVMRDNETLTAMIGKCKLCVLDDLGAERATEWTTEILQQIIQTRYDKMLSTIITTNMNAETMLRHYGQAMEGTAAQRMLSRLAEMCDVVECKGEDGRIRRAHNGRAKDETHA